MNKIKIDLSIGSKSLIEQLVEQEYYPPMMSFETIERIKEALIRFECIKNGIRTLNLEGYIDEEIKEILIGQFMDELLSVAEKFLD